MNINFRCHPAVLPVFSFVCLRIVFSCIGRGYCYNTVPCFYHTLIVFMVHLTVLCFHWSLHQLKMFVMLVYKVIDTTGSQKPLLHSNMSIGFQVGNRGSQAMCQSRQNRRPRKRVLMKHFTETDHCGFFIIKPTRCNDFLKFYFGMKPYMFRTKELSETCRVSFQNKIWENQCI
jgi:hypothetical protein